MQLIEIIQLVLIGFVLISLVVFSISYLGYRRKEKSNPHFKKKQPARIINAEIKKPEVIEPAQVPNDDIIKDDIIKKTGLQKKDRKKFEVFKPSPTDPSLLNSKAINIKPAQKPK